MTHQKKVGFLSSSVIPITSDFDQRLFGHDANADQVGFSMSLTERPRRSASGGESLG
jgi:hypothetical protein